MQSWYSRPWNALYSPLGTIIASIALLCCMGIVAFDPFLLFQAFDTRFEFRKASTNPPKNPLKRAVIAAHYEENVAWLNEVSRHWQVTIMGPGGLPVNKGQEAMAYLTYIIQNYNNLPESMAFIHSHQSSWHTPQSQLETLLKVPCWERVPYASITSSAFQGKWMGAHAHASTEYRRSHR